MAHKHAGDSEKQATHCVITHDHPSRLHAKVRVRVCVGVYVRWAT
jgi:hypothetical protein